jgi:uncharacterized cupredoxin-like copper-binding protein
VATFANWRASVKEDDDVKAGSGRARLIPVLLSLASLAACGLVGSSGEPPVVVQIRQDIESITFSPDRARVGQRVRFQIEVSDNFQHEFEAKGTPVQDVKVSRSKPQSVDWAPDKAGAIEFTCDVPGHKEKGTFTVQP